MGVFLIFAIPLIALIVFFVLISIASRSKAEVRLLDEKSGYYEDKIKSKFWYFLWQKCHKELIHWVVGIFMVLFSIVVCIFSIMAIANVAKRDVKYNEKYLEYILLTREIGADENNFYIFYEDICNYNNAVLEDKYWADNLWVNWYHNGLIKDLPLIGEGKGV